MWGHWFILYNSFVLMIHQTSKKALLSFSWESVSGKKTGKNSFLKWIIHNIYVYISYVYFYIFDIDSNSLDLNDLIMYIPISITSHSLLKCEFLSVCNFSNIAAPHILGINVIFLLQLGKRKCHVRVLHTSYQWWLRNWRLYRYIYF